MLAVDTRRTQAVELSGALRAYLQKSYGESDEQYVDEFRMLDQLRNEILSPDTHPSSVEAHLRYFGQLKYVAAKFPVDEHNIRVPFVWWTSFTKDKRPITQSHMNFERASILFNIGAIYSRLGEAESRATDEGLRKACEWFKRSAGAFSMLKNMIESELRNFSPTLDMQPATLDCLYCAMMAQATECVWLKAVAGGSMKDATIARIAAEVAFLYQRSAESIAGSQAALMAGMVHFLNHIRAKYNYFLAHSEYRKAEDCKGQSQYGEAVGRLQAAQGMIKKALSDQKYITAPLVADIKALQSRVETSLTSAVKDNDVVYVQPVVKDPAAVAPLPCAKVGVEPTEPELTTEVVGRPLFHALVPFEVHQIASEYTAKRDGRVQELAMQMRAFQSDAWAQLRSRELPGALEAITSPPTSASGALPAAVVDRSREFVNGGGLSHLEDQLRVLSASAQRAQAMFREIEGTLDAEARDDAEMKSTFHEKWNRTPSSILQRQVRDRLADLKDKLAIAVTSDESIRQSFDANRSKIEMLADPHKHLEPFTSADAAAAARIAQLPVCIALKDLVSKYEQVVRQAESLQEEMKLLASDDDIGPQLVNMVAEKGTAQGLDRNLIFERLARYDSFKSRLDDLRQVLTALWVQIEQKHGDFVQVANPSARTEQRQTVLGELDTAHRIVEEIKSNYTEGHKFYSDLSRVLDRLKTQVDDYCHARHIEKRELLSDVTSSLATGGQGLASAPPLPPRGSPAGNSGAYPGNQPSGIVPGTWKNDQPVRFNSNAGFKKP